MGPVLALLIVPGTGITCIAFCLYDLDGVSSLWSRIGYIGLGLLGTGLLVLAFLRMKAEADKEAEDENDEEGS